MDRKTILNNELAKNGQQIERIYIVCAYVHQVGDNDYQKYSYLRYARVG